LLTVYVQDEWEVPREKVKVGVELGQGSFGMVYEGILSDYIDNQPKLKVAIKVSNALFSFIHPLRLSSISLNLCMYGLSNLYFVR